MEIVNSASDSCELTLGSSSLEQEELQVLDVGPGGEGKFPFLLLGLGVSIILDCHWNSLILDVHWTCGKPETCQQVSENSS